MHIISETTKDLYLTRIANNESKIRKYERSIESLDNFKKQVRKSKESFSHAHSNNEKLINDLNNYKKYNNTISIFFKGIKHIVNSVGYHYVLTTFKVLLTFISVKRADYVTKVMGLESDNRLMNADIEMWHYSTRTKE